MNQADFPLDTFEALGIGQGQTSLADIIFAVFAVVLVCWLAPRLFPAE